MPRVSVVVPAYNNADFIVETVRSILGQTFTDFELLIADHASTDGTWALLQQFCEDPRVRLSQTAQGGGARRNWNAASQQASGEFCKLVCGDDLLMPNALAKQVAAFDAGGKAVVMVAAQRDLIDANGKPFIRARGLGALSGVVPGVAALRASVRAGTNLFGEPACVLLRTADLAAVGWWADLNYYIDAGTYAEVLVRGELVALREPLAAFRISASQWSVALMRSQAAEAAQFHRRAQSLAPQEISAADVRPTCGSATCAPANRRSSAGRPMWCSDGVCTAPQVDRRRRCSLPRLASRLRFRAGSQRAH